MPADLRALSSLIVGFVRTAMLFRPSYTSA
jgi:hypothetical protein